MLHREEVISPSVSRESPAIVFVNPFAGGGRAKRWLPKIRRLFEAHQFFAEFVNTSTSQDLESRARNAVATGSRTLLALGGDGTFQGLVNAAFGSDVVLGVLPAGGGNDFASALGLPSHPLHAAQSILTARPLPVDLLRAHTYDGYDRLYLGGGGLGLDANAARLARSVYAPLPGRSRYLAAAIHALLRFDALIVRADFPGTTLPSVERRVLLASILNTPTFGAGIRLAPESCLDDGLLTTILVNDLSALRTLALVPGLLLRGELPRRLLYRVVAKCVRLTPDRLVLFHGDGEIFGPAPVEIEVVPNAIRVLTPATETRQGVKGGE